MSQDDRVAMSSSFGVSLRGGDITVGADLGQQRGGNLFHSFRKFDLDTGGLLPGVVGLEDRPGDVRQPQPVLGNGATCCHRPT